MGKDICDRILINCMRSLPPNPNDWAEPSKNPWFSRTYRYLADLYSDEKTTKRRFINDEGVRSSDLCCSRISVCSRILNGDNWQVKSVVSVIVAYLLHWFHRVGLIANHDAHCRAMATATMGAFDARAPGLRSMAANAIRLVSWLARHRLASRRARCHR